MHQHNRSTSIVRAFFISNRSKGLWLAAIALQLAACSSQKQLSKAANTTLFEDSIVQHAHVGISLYDVSAKKYLYNHNGKKYFVPASNTKLFSCYAAMKYLGDSLPGITYWQNDTAIYLTATGDPSLLHADFKKQPVIEFLQQTKKSVYITDHNWKEQALGPGWAWNDYNDNYMAERSPLPVYGNMVHWVQEMGTEDAGNAELVATPFIYSIPEINWKVRFNTGVTRKAFFVQRNKDENFFLITEGKEKKKEQDVPFVTHGLQSAIELLPDTIGKRVAYLPTLRKNLFWPITTIYSQPTDSLLQPMMYRSDNFYAEQALLMVSQSVLGEMNNAKIIDTLLKTDLKALPQKPRWVDGSGLSRYNLFTPNDFVVLLQKMEQEFGMKRLQIVLPTGGKGTLNNAYKQDSTNYIFAKTGTLSGVVALSGYLYTKKNKLLIFSILINNHTGNAGAVRKRIEAFLTGIRNRY